MSTSFSTLFLTSLTLLGIICNNSCTDTKSSLISHYVNQQPDSNLTLIVQYHVKVIIPGASIILYTLIPIPILSFLYSHSHSYTLIPIPILSFPFLYSHSHSYTLISIPILSFPFLYSHSYTLIPIPILSFPFLYFHSHSYTLIPIPILSFPFLYFHSHSYTLIPILSFTISLTPLNYINHQTPPTHLYGIHLFSIPVLTCLNL